MEDSEWEQNERGGKDEELKEATHEDPEMPRFAGEFERERDEKSIRGENDATCFEMGDAKGDEVLQEL